MKHYLKELFLNLITMPNEFMKRYGSFSRAPKWKPKSEQQMRIEIQSARAQLIYCADKLLDKWMVDDEDGKLHSIWEQINHVIERLNKV
jgi:hypothetical protein